VTVKLKEAFALFDVSILTLPLASVTPLACSLMPPLKVNLSLI